MTDGLNQMISTGSNGVYTGGKGVVVRNVMDGLIDSNLNVVPATLLVNDLFMPSTVYPQDNPECPNSGYSGYNHFQSCGYVPWDFATVAVVVGSNMSSVMYDFDNIQSSTWGWGVFYPTDSNSADKRCRWLESKNMYDCPGGTVQNGVFRPDSSHGGAGYYPAGNPYTNMGGGGGAGCHFSAYDLKNIDQTDAIGPQGNLVGNADCECNYKLKNNGWSDWYRQWYSRAAPKKGFEWQAWFGEGKAPSFALDVVSCWVDNPRDMIEIQNQIWWNRLAASLPGPAVL